MTTVIEYGLMAGHAYRATRDEINWLPAPQGPFRLVLRAYLSSRELMEGRGIALPVV